MNWKQLTKELMQDFQPERWKAMTPAAREKLLEETALSKQSQVSEQMALWRRANPGKSAYPAMLAVVEGAQEIAMHELIEEIRATATTLGEFD